MYLIAGLGNPTAQYEKTRHNIGFDAVDVLARKCGITMNRRQCQALTGTGYCEGQKVLLAKPLTYMNLSGHSIRDLMRYYRLDPEQDLIVLYDDISLDPGSIRVRKKGSAGGHNGIKDIIAMTGTSDFSRVRIGVGAKPRDWDLADYVLGRMQGEDRKQADQALEEAAQAVGLMITGRTDEAMNRFNRKKKPVPKETEPADKESRSS